MRYTARMTYLRANAWLLCGGAAFSVFALVPVLVHAYVVAAALLALAIAAVAGYRQAPADDFFAGVAVAFVFWLCAGLVFGPKGAAIAALFVGPLVFISTFVLGCLCFFAGRLAARFAGASRKTH